MSDIDQLFTQVDLSITGMSDRASALTIERGLNNLKGVEATVNLAAKSARVTYHSGMADTVKLLPQCVAWLWCPKFADTTPDMLDAEVIERVAILRVRLVRDLGLPVTAMSR